MAVMNRLNVALVFKSEADRNLWAAEIKKYIESKRDDVSLPVWVGGEVSKDGYIVQDIKEDKAALSDKIGNVAKFDSEIAAELLITDPIIEEIIK